MKTYSSPEQREIRRRCRDIINGGPINKSRVVSALEGTKILEKYSFLQIRTRLAYERKLTQNVKD